MRLLANVLALVALLGGASWGASIGLFSDAAGTSCNLAIPPGGIGVFYIVAVDPEHAPLCCGPGFTGAAFSIAGLPAGWLTTLTPSPQAAATVGNPSGGDVAIAFTTSQSGHTIPLFTVTVTPTGATTSATLTVQPPSFPMPFTDIHCPYVVGTGSCPCDPDAACVDAGILYVNTPGDCLVPVSPVTWSRVRMLYD